jgi:uroporphyrinogen-III synthase
VSADTPRRSILVTGPSADPERFAEAAAEAGWNATPCPLVEIRQRELDLATHGDPAPERICVTSRHALLSLVNAREVFTSVPCSVVGSRTGEQLTALGFTLAGPAAPTAAALAEALSSELAPGTRVLWPRGSLSDELARRLEAAGAVVDAPVVYATLPRVLDEDLPATDAVFLASPSAVIRWSELAPPELRPLAVAIGPTTLEAIEAEGEDRFAGMLALLEPTPAALRSCLESILPETTP